MNTAGELSDIENANSMSCETWREGEFKVGQTAKSSAESLRSLCGCARYQKKENKQQRSSRKAKRKVNELYVAIYFASSRIGLREEKKVLRSALCRCECWVLSEARNVILSKYEEMNLDGNVVLREKIIKPAAKCKKRFVEMK